MRAPYGRTGRYRPYAGTPRRHAEATGLVAARPREGASVRRGICSQRAKSTVFEENIGNRLPPT
eukprot:1284804-Rhodomonas_salina.2